MILFTLHLPKPSNKFLFFKLYALSHNSLAALVLISQPSTYLLTLSSIFSELIDLLIISLPILINTIIALDFILFFIGLLCNNFSFKFCHDFPNSFSTFFIKAILPFNESFLFFHVLHSLFHDAS